ncbi:glutaminyl-peptide cyclotransferase [Candidatus Fermentibacteria bacterium]|nr:glutaminyl-peptide cyclotransferase [Candidatus Fermentibacteria bacterium]
MNLSARLKALAFVCALLLPGCSSPPGETGGVPVHRPRIIDVRSHRATVFTQGLEAYQDRVYESGGGYGSSTISILDLSDYRVSLTVSLPDSVFAEGLTLLDGVGYLLTWREGTAYTFDPESLRILSRLPLETEGWGICEYRGNLLTSDGSNVIRVRNPESFLPVDSFQVTVSGRPQGGLNELESVGRFVLANRYRSDRILVIDPSTGEVVLILDCSALLDRRRFPRAGVLNGTALLPDSTGLLVTGKNWPYSFTVGLEWLERLNPRGQD